jgi:hypothetical protein
MREFSNSKGNLMRYDFLIVGAGFAGAVAKDSPVNGTSATVFRPMSDS